METAAQKTARLRALRYARDGSPEENKAAKKELKAALTRANHARSEALFDAVRIGLRVNPDVVVNNLEAIGNAAAHLTHQQKRIDRL